MFGCHKTTYGVPQGIALETIPKTTIITVNNLLKLNADAPLSFADDNKRFVLLFLLLI